MIYLTSSLPEAAARLDDSLARLEALGFQELAQLPEWSSENDSVSDLQITLYRKKLDDGRLEIVVQARRLGKRWLFVQRDRVLARGFWISPQALPVRMPSRALEAYS